MTREDLDFIGSMNMCDEISNEAYKKIMCHCEEQQPSEEYKRGWQDAITTALKETHNYYTEDGVFKAIQEESLVGVGMMQEPKTYSDCISRQAVKELFEEGDVIGIYDFLGIGDMPSVQPKAEQEPCEDCISRIETLKHSHIEYNDDGEGHRVVYCEDIEQMPSVQPKQGWIPCSEKNPNETGEYLTTIKWLNRENTYSYMVVKRDYYADMETWNDSLVIAWMPLPQPYNAESDEESE